MRRSAIRFSQIAGLFRSLGERPALVAGVALAALLLVVARFEPHLLREVGDGIGDGLVPAVALVREPVAVARRLGGEIGALLAVHRENARLKAENERLLAWQDQAVRLGVENQALRGMLDMPERGPEADWTTARIVADSAGPFVHTRLIDAGSSRGIAPGMPVLTPRGMIGRVISVGERSARVLLITDFNSKIPVIVERSGDQALLAGDNTAEPKLEFLPLGPRFSIGDRVMTSGRGGILPPGLMLGEISRIEERRVAVRPFADGDQIDFVAVLRTTPLPAPEGGLDGAWPRTDLLAQR